jgi:hypothetical protein
MSSTPLDYALRETARAAPAPGREYQDQQVRMQVKF